MTSYLTLKDQKARNELLLDSEDTDEMQHNKKRIDDH